MIVFKPPSRFVKVPGYRSILASPEGEIYFKKTGHITKGGISGRYLRVSVKENNVRELCYVHVLICTTFNGGFKKGLVVGHKNDIRTDNRASNLEWITQSQNIKDTYARGIRKPTYKVSKESFKDLGYYHISFKNDLAGLWKPMNPAGSELGDGLYPEPKTPRISLAPTIEGCFRGVYPNVYQYFEVNNFPYMNFYVYRPIGISEEDLVKSSFLTKERLVWDAHETQEAWITEPVKMELVAEVKIYNTNKSKTKYTFPFNDSKLPKQSIGPMEIKYKVTRYYKTGVNLESFKLPDYILNKPVYLR